MNSEKTSAKLHEGFLSLPLVDDWHLHLRDGPQLETYVLASARYCKRALIMPNLVPPVTTAESALAYRDRIMTSLVKSAVKEGIKTPDFTPYMTLYLTDSTTASDIKAASSTGVIVACKLYPAGATTNSSSGVTNIHKLDPVFEAMTKEGMVLCVHGETTCSDVDIFDREAVFIAETLRPLLLRHPSLKVVMEHITTADAVTFVLECGDNVAATLTPQHLLYSRNALFEGGLQPHMYCLPVLKAEPHRHALVQAVLSGNPKFFAGSDSAPHLRANKEKTCGCAGCYTAPIALPLYAEVFSSQNALHLLEAFVSEHGARFYGLTDNTESYTTHTNAHVYSDDLSGADSVCGSKLRECNVKGLVCSSQHVLLKRENWTVANEIDIVTSINTKNSQEAYGNTEVITPFRGGKTMQWKLVASSNYVKL